METQLKIVSNRIFGDIEILIEDGKEWFGATQVAKALGYENPWGAISTHCRKKGLAKRVILTRGGKQEMNFIDSAEEVARRCGIYTAAKYMAKPHGRFIHNLIHAQLIEIDEEEIIFHPTSYLESVVPKVLDWLERRNYPTEITFGNTIHRVQYFRPERM